jgi:hypothetical protein
MTEKIVTMTETIVTMTETIVTMTETIVTMTETIVSMTETIVTMTETIVSMTETIVSMYEEGIAGCLRTTCGGEHRAPVRDRLQRHSAGRDRITVERNQRSHNSCHLAGQAGPVGRAQADCPQDAEARVLLAKEGLAAYLFRLKRSLGSHS